jgi:protease I
VKTEPVHALKQAGAKVTVIAPKPGHIQGMDNDKAAGALPVDAELGTVEADSYDALLLPGGVANPDKLRAIPEAVAFVREFVEAGKPIAAIGHGPWTLIKAGAVKGRTLTSWPSLKADLSNAGATWVDREVVVDGTLVTSRMPDDIPAFTRRMLEVFAAAGRGAA